MIYVIATANLKDGTSELFIEGARVCIAATLKEEGCLSYDLNRSVTDPNRFVFVETWTSREALAGHFKAPHLQAWRSVAGQCVAVPTVVEIISPAGVEKR